MEQEMNELFRLELAKLLKATEGCREDMHEPDEQDLTARVVGTVLNNACGSGIREKAVTVGYQEMILVLQRNGKTWTINMADLIALARKAQI